MKRAWTRIVRASFLIGAAVPALVASQLPANVQPHGPYARIAMMRALDESHTVDLEAGYVRHLEWHRRASDPFGWYSYSVWASTERQRWIIYATFGHSAAELSNPVAPAEDERDSIVNILPHVQYMGSGIYEFLPAVSRGTGVPTPTPVAEYTTVDLTYGSERAFESALGDDQQALLGETLWYRLVVGGSGSRYVRIRPRLSLANILDERPSQALPVGVHDLVSRMTIETLNLRPTMLVNVTPVPPR